MGFFSWETADTQESVMNRHTDKCKTVYLLQPNGNPPITEENYDGFGVFGGIDAYEWLAKTNADDLGIDIAGFEQEALRNLGFALVYGKFYIAADTGEYWIARLNESAITAIIKSAEPNATIKVMKYWSEGIPQYDGLSAYELVEQEAFLYKPVSEFIEVKYPIKLSFNPDAVYENLSASKRCPRQGFGFFG